MTTTSGAPAGTEGSNGRTGSSRMAQKQRAPSDGTDSPTNGGREPWISTNKILNSSLCGRRINSRNPNFDYDETKLLIALWGDPVVQKTLITTHKKHPVIAELARKMRDQGYNRSTEEINTRIKNLKCFYNRIKKDMAAGIINQTTWRHYAEMDDIISRPVFGNAHRLYMMQQEKQDGQRESQPPDAPDGEKDPLHQFPVKLEVMSDDDEEEYDDGATAIRAEDLLTIDTKIPDDPSSAASRNTKATRTSGRNGTGNKAARPANGRRAKATEDEDDDDDEDEDDEYDDDEGSDFDVEGEFNDGLDELLQKAQATKSSGPGSIPGSIPKPTAFGIASTATSKAANASGLVIETITSGNGTTITATSSASSTTVPGAGKISVVPTNLLMKQGTVSSSMATPIQIYTPPTASIATGATTMVTSATTGPTTIGGVAPTGGVAPMKLLLVNTVAKDGTTKQILTPAPADSGSGMPKLIPAPVQHSKIPLSLGGPNPIVTIPTMNMPKKNGDATGKMGNAGRHPNGGGQSGGFRTLLTQLVTIQRENLALNQERLALEKERLEFEKQFGGSLVSMVRNMSTFFSGMLHHQRKEIPTSGSPEPDGKTQPQEMLKNGERDPTPPRIVPEPRGSSNDREICTTSRACTPRAVTPTPKALAQDSDGEKTLTSITPAKRPASSTPPPLTPAPVTKLTPSQSPSCSSVDVSLPKKRRMVTRNSAQVSQASSETDDVLKTEVISDIDDH